MGLVVLPFQSAGDPQIGMHIPIRNSKGVLRIR